MPAKEPNRVDSAEVGEPTSLTAKSEMVSHVPLCPPALATDAEIPALATGQIIEDYEIIRVLGVGGFARVYLARQISLNRLVALKVSANQGSEARTLARLEHQHIVQVFAEIVLVERNLRLLSIQFVPGITLAGVIKALVHLPADARHGRAFLGILDELCTETTMFDLGGLEVRAYLQTCNQVELVCWLGARLTEALAHAHSQGVFHRDIKPANILVNRYGRPFLADFNIAYDADAGAGNLGGTIAYMAPEQLDAVMPGADRARIRVDGRADLYALAVVLFEFLTGAQPFRYLIDECRASLREISRERHLSPPSARAFAPGVPELMDRVLGRCMQPDPERRFAGAAEMMHALDGCRDLMQVEKAPGQQSWLVQVCRARPFLMLVLLGLLPHLIGSVVNVLYNQQLVVTKEPAQQAEFQRLVLMYNAVVYPLLVFAGVYLIRRAWVGRQKLQTSADIMPEETMLVRRQTLALPGWIVILSCLGWFPGGILFPLCLHSETGPLAPGDFMHFFISFAVSGLIATTYTYFAVAFVVLRVLYPRLWSDPSHARVLMREELRGLPGRLRLFQIFAVLIPLIGAALLIGAGPDHLTLAFRLLVTSLIVLGLAGFWLATRTCNHLTQVLALLVGSDHQK